MRLRAACQRDIEVIHQLFDEGNFKLDTKHLERLVVAEKDNKIVGILYLNTVLEASFIAPKTASKKSRILALKQLIELGKHEAKEIGFDLVHAFANDETKGILKKHFGFEPGKGENLVLFVE